jgi:NAD+ synthase
MARTAARPPLVASGSVTHRPPSPAHGAPLAIDTEAEIDRLSHWLRKTIGQVLRKRGAVLGVSGGVDSAVCAALAAHALGRDRVLALLMPERESSADSLLRGRELCEQLGIEHRVIELTPVLDALGVYQARDDAIRTLVPAYGPGWRCHLAIAGGLTGGINFFHLRLENPAGLTHQLRLPLATYLAIVAATNHKQRGRKTQEYFHADRLNRCVVGTANRLEHELGFFVKQGDGLADVKPIAHLYKTQVYRMAEALGLPSSIRHAAPTTDTYSLAQGQDAFYYGLPHGQMDLALWVVNSGGGAAAVAMQLGCTAEDAERIIKGITAKRAVAESLHTPGLLPT